jgi:hypothetical protein
MPRLSTEEVNQLLESGGRELYAELKRLPGDVDVSLASMRVIEMFKNGGFGFARSFRRHLPLPVIEAVVEKLERDFEQYEGRFRNNVVLLLERLRLRTQEESIHDAWRHALQLLLDIDTTYGWGSKQRKTKLRGLSESPITVATLQAVCVASERPKLDVLVVLALEGSDESMDALMPHFSTSDFDAKLERLEALRTHIPRDGSRADVWLKTAETQLQEHRHDSPALAFAESLGFTGTKKFWFECSIGTVERSPNRLNPRFRCSIHLDSRRSTWFGVHVYQVEGRRRSYFGETTAVDELELGSCLPAELPDWLTRAAEKLQCSWGEPYFRSSLRGKKRQALLDWLLG